ncbi:DUF1573 domain-containing protein [Kamptonema cortianum]|nr:DUF1573 domain-containing protein [Geitlerinema splendidum]MDK3162139.1 DUF1573 domain-containing protein [Kamptonema cortianum]
MTILSALSILVVAQVQPGPIPSAGTSPGFQSTVLAATQALESGEFESAKSLVSKLPKKTIRVRWDDAKLDRIQKSTFQAAAKYGVEAWQASMPDLKVEFVTTGIPDILVTFAEDLPVGIESGLPQGLVVFTSDAPAEPRLEGVIALKRMLPPVEIEALHVQAEFSYLIGEFLGLARFPRLGSVMGRTDGMGSILSPVDPATVKAVEENLAIVRELERAISSKTRMAALRPKMSVKVNEIQLGQMIQGEGKAFQFEVTNLGNGPMNLSIRPDCSCFTIQAASTIQPQETALVSIWMDTSEFIGPQDKGIFLFSNDAENSVHKLSIRGHIQPAFRFLSSSKTDQTYYADETGGKATLYLVHPEDRPFRILESRVSGLLGQVSVTPWEGELADPALREGPKQRIGYKLELMVSPSTLSGRVPVSMTFITDHPQFRVISNTLYFQKGVVATPQAVYFGNVEGGISRAWVILSQPGKPFKVTKVEPLTSDISARLEEYGNGDQKLIVELDTRGKKGDFLSSIKVYIEGIVEPLVVPVQAHVK